MTDLSPPGNALIWVGVGRGGVLLISPRRSARERDLKSAVDLAFVLGLRDRQPPDLRRAAHVCPTVSLRIEAFDLHYADLANFRRQQIPGQAGEIRPLKFFAGDKPHQDAPALRKDAVRFRFDRGHALL